MCTVNWVRQPGGYVLLCNRDERHTRKPAGGPRVGVRRGVSFVAPVDGDYGGSWIGANQFGLTLSLLNRYENGKADSNTAYTSRGLLLADLLDCPHGEAVSQRLRDADLTQFRPFTLVAISVEDSSVLIDWDGSECNVDLAVEARLPLISSSFKESNVCATRRKLFAEMFLHRGSLAVESLRQFHESHLPERGPYSVCMHREDAATVSLSIVTVTQDNVEFLYQPTAPCVEATPERASLQRALVHSAMP